MSVIAFCGMKIFLTECFHLSASLYNLIWCSNIVINQFCWEVGTKLCLLFISTKSKLCSLHISFRNQQSVWLQFIPLPDNKILDWSKLKQIADNILKSIEKKVPNRVGNIVRKGEIACYEQFLLFPQCFPQLYIFNKSKCCLVW